MNYETTKKEVFESLIGCTTYIDKTNGYLIIDSKSFLLRIARNDVNNDVCAVGMLVEVGERGRLFVRYGYGTICLYDREHTKII